MNFSKNKLLFLVPLISLAVLFIFLLTQIPSARLAPKNLPIAIVNEDKGIETPDKGTVNLGDTMVATITESTLAAAGNKDPAIKWVTVAGYMQAKEGMDNQEYYGALVIPQDFSQKQVSLQTPSPASPEFGIYVNQGMNAAAANTVTQALNGIVDNINVSASAQLQEALTKQGGSLTLQQAQLLAAPISKAVSYVNPTGTQANAPVALFQPVWMGSLIAAVLTWMALKKARTSNNKLKVLIIHVLVGAVTALFIGFGVTWMAQGILDYQIPEFTDTALFLSIASFSFILMISAVLLWVGMAGMPIFVLLLFFGAPLLAMAPELMPRFYQNWVYTWLPMRFMVDGLRGLFFFGEGLHWSGAVSVLVWIGLGSLTVGYLSLFKRAAQPVKQAEISSLG
ncbi:YhgE/Pip domain-containing protein [Paenibacillus ihuae]|uniref:YhgE/Pip domain-containing protein n=1 Tax=Paenibacillus ihuae TaxID=1232431 RepID=UPI0006D53A63|nr:DUF3533 domain-containing protein [Paenibacillus ihuae]